MFEKKSIQKIKPYKLSSHKVWGYKKDHDVLKLDWNEATIKPSPKVISAIKHEIDNARLNWYPDINNIELVELIAKYNNVKNNQIQYFASSDCLHEYIVRCFIEVEDKILVIGPTYDNFRAVAESNDANILNFSLDGNFKLDFKKFELYLTKIKPKMVYIVNPNNPTGSLHSVDKLTKIISKFNNVLFIVDEAYYEFSGQSISKEVSEHNNILISRTFSKAFALASFRIGYVISNKINISLLNKIRNPKNISHFAQVAAIAALKDIQYTSSYAEEVKSAKSLLENYLLNIDSVQLFSGSGNFVFLKIISSNLKKTLIEFLNNNKIFIRDYGHVKSTKNFVRITIGTQLQTKRVINILEKFFNK